MLSQLGSDFAFALAYAGVLQGMGVTPRNLIKNRARIFHLKLGR